MIEIFDLLTPRQRKEELSLIFRDIVLVLSIAVGVYVMFIRGGNV